MWLLLLPNHMWFAGFTKQDCEKLRKKYPEFTDEEIKIVKVDEEELECIPFYTKIILMIEIA